MKFKNFFFVGITLFGLFSCKQTQKNETFLRPVKLTQVNSLNSIQKSFSGVVASDQYSDLAFKMSGPILKMNVVEGQRVKKGDIIAIIDPVDYKLDYEAKKASFEKSKASFERSQKLLSRNAISVQEFEANKAAFTTAKSAFDNSGNTLNDTKLVAPFDGFIQKRYVENYQRVQPGQPIVCLVNPKKLQVNFTLAENDVKYITNSNSISVEFDAYKGQKFNAKLKEYVQASVGGVGVPVSLYIDDSNFSLDKYNVSVGYSCRVFIDKRDESSSEGLIVPLSAILYDNNNNTKSVFVYNDATKKVEQRSITDKGTIIDKENVIVSGNISAGDKIVVAGASRLTNGQEVKLLAE